MANDDKRVIYQDDRIEISQREYPDEHDVMVDGDNGAYCLLPRGVLHDLARRRDIDNFRSSMNALNNIFVRELEEKKISLETLAWAFSKARMKELEDEVHYFMDEARKAKE